ncbi:MAG: hypothetical protein HKN82_15635 [Akkermansiaceae bacterium]|nr:hypothetical protein [Akkermansiaceae bacterium]NNM30039.1 hypothetical protein [Akkermansiaceae bacterium]
MKLFALAAAAVMGLSGGLAGQTEDPAEPSGSGKPGLFGKGSEESFEGKVIVIRVGENDLINKQSFKFWRRTLRRAEEENATAVVFEIDTPGGLAFETKEIMTEITKLKVPSFAWVEGDAISAGALVAVATDAIYMSPDSLIGAAGLVSSMGEMDKMMRRKVESLFEAHVRVVVEKKGHNLEVVRAMMIPEDEERVFGEVVVKKDDLLTLTANQAVSDLEGKPVLAKGIVEDLDALLENEGLSGVPVVRAAPTPFERLAWWITYASPILILIGVGAAYVEMKAPGFGVGGALSLAAFGLFFFGNYVAGNLAGYELAGIFVLGVILILVEIFLIPGTGVTGILGGILVVGSLLFGMVDKFEWQDLGEGGFSVGELSDLLRLPALLLAIGLLGALALVLILMAYLPKIPMMNWLTLQKELSGGASIAGSGEVVEERIGWTGVAVTDLRPAGKVRFRDASFDVVTGGEFVAAGAKVRVVSEDGMRLVVSPIEGA